MREQKELNARKRNILILFHDTNHLMIQHYLIDYVNDNIYTEPTIISLTDGSMLKSFSCETFDLILVPMRKCRVWEQVENRWHFPTSFFIEEQWYYILHRIRFV